MRSLFFLFAFVFAAQNGFAQYSLNDYKYVIVENQFHFQNEPDQYDLNRMVRFQFEKYGFNAFIEGQTIPEDMKSNYCLALRSVVQCKGALRTKATIELYDCNNNLVYVSQEGITREKEFRRAYDVSIRKAFESFEALNYSYSPSQQDEKTTATVAKFEEIKEAQSEIAELKEEIKELKKEKESKPEEPEETKPEFKLQKSNNELPQEKEVDQVVAESSETAKKEEKKKKKKKSSKGDTSDKNMYDLQKANDEFDKEKEEKQISPNPSVNYIAATISSRGKEESIELIQSTNSGIYLVKNENAVLYKAGSIWILLRHANGQVTEEPVRIKFQ